MIEPTPLLACADPDRLVQVLLNLVSNTIKFSPPAGTVRVMAVQQPEFVDVRIVDQGRSVPAEFRQTIFERFHRVQASDTKEKGGSGLCLAICKAIIEGHQGQIGVDSEEGEGSTFWFRLPKQSEPIKTSTPEAVKEPA